LQDLSKALEQGDNAATEAFWEEMGKHGTPLIEPIEGDEANHRVTFLWRGLEPLAGVRLISLLTDRHSNFLQRLAETDVWFLECVVASDVRATYQFHPKRDDSPEQEGLARFADYVHDPLNPKTAVFEKDEEDPDGFELIRSMLEMPQAAPQPLNERRAGVPEGSIEMHRLRSEILDNERRVWIYTPAGYDPTRSEPYDLLVLLDGTAFVRMSPLPTILDNLIATGAIPPLVAVMPCSLSQSIRFRELLLHDPFNAFLAEELIPWAHRTVHVANDPDRVVICGASAGGLAATYAAVEHPELFGNVLSLSGAFVFSPGVGLENLGGGGEPEWLSRRISAMEKVPVRFYLAAGTLEVHSLRDHGGAPNLLVTNRHLRTVLEAKGVPVHLDEFPGGHDMISWQAALPRGLATLLG
jgi:enterochelin esterase family protein